MIFFLQGIALLGIGVLGLLIKYYLPSYTAKKGENLATKDDVAEITRQIEGEKAAGI